MIVTYVPSIFPLATNISDANQATPTAAPKPQTARIGDHLATSEGVIPATLTLDLNAGEKRARLWGRMRVGIMSVCCDECLRILTSHCSALKLDPTRLAGYPDRTSEIEDGLESTLTSQLTAGLSLPY